MTAPTAVRTVAFLSDFGLSDPFVGICHGVIRRIDPTIPIIDLTHGIARHDVDAGAVALADSVRFMPDASVFVAVVDPGVGSGRRALAIEANDGSFFVGPDNGLMLSAIERLGGVSAVVEISESPWRSGAVSATFHGRDIFCPVAARLAAGASLEEAGTPLEAGELTRLTVPQLRISGDRLIASVISIDEFGNVRLTGRFSDVGNVFRGDQVTIDVAGRELRVVAATSYADGSSGALLLIEDSTGSLSLAANQGDAAAMLDLAIGDSVRLTRR